MKCKRRKFRLLKPGAWIFSKGQPIPPVGERIAQKDGTKVGVVASVEELRRWVRVIVQ